MNENPQIQDRRPWLDYLAAHDYLIPPTEAVTAVDQYVHLRDASPATVAAFSRYFSAYLLLAGIAAEAEYKHALRDAGVTAGMRLLDVGCGSGPHAHFMLDLGAAEVVGLDLAEPALALARDLPRLPAYEGLHDPASPEYLFRRPDLYLCDVVEVATAVIQKGPSHE